jgi:hypothetical protein
MRRGTQCLPKGTRGAAQAGTQQMDTASAWLRSVCSDPVLLVDERHGLRVSPVETPVRRRNAVRLGALLDYRQREGISVAYRALRRRPPEGRRTQVGAPQGDCDALRGLRPSEDTTSGATRASHRSAAAPGAGSRPGPRRASAPRAGHAVPPGPAARRNLFRPDRSRRRADLPPFVRDDFGAFLGCGVLAHSRTTKGCSRRCHAGANLPPGGRRSDCVTTATTVGLIVEPRRGLRGRLESSAR